MLKTIKFTILPTIWVDVKGLRMSFMQYLMLVVIFPLSYLIINTSGGTSNHLYNVTGMLISMLMSLFINMQATLVASSNNVTIIETYSVYKVKPLMVFLSQCLLHFLMSIGIFIVSEIILVSYGVRPQIIKLIVWLIIAFVFLHAVSVALGSVLKNPNMAGAIINLLYMILVMITPLYSSTEGISTTGRIFYLLNPFSHLISLLYWSNDMKPLCSFWISILILALLTIVLDIFTYKRWNNAHAIEKLTLL